MSFIKGFDRNQTLALFSWDMEVDPESDARIIDQFVNNLDLSKYGIKEVSHEGHPAYDPKSMLKLYIYGYENEIYSSRKLAKSCKVNVEVKWMIGGVRPDFRTISDFRKNNILAMEKIFHEFNQRIKLELGWSFLSVDESKFYANNSKKANFMKEKLDERTERLLKKEKEYLRILDEMDKQEDTE